MYRNWTIESAIQYAAAAAVQLQQNLYMPQNSVKYTVEISSEESDDAEDEQKRTIFCANLDDRVTEEMLYEAFLQSGPIESVRIPKDNSGNQRSFGFVQYVHACSARYAMQLYQGLTFFRKQITIKYQGNPNPPPIRQNTSHVDYDTSRRKQRSGGENGGSGGSGSRYDNFSLRGSNFPAAYEQNDQGRNPFKHDSKSPDNWTAGTSGRRSKGGISKHASSQSRPHLNAAPYQRSESSQRRSGDDSNDRDRNDHSNQSRYAHNRGSNRRFEQRSGRRS